MDESHSDDGSIKKRPIKRSFDSPPTSSPTSKDDQMHSPVSVTSSEANSVLCSQFMPRPNHVDTLHYIFPFYSERTLKLTLEECNNNILQAVLQISQDLLSFRVPFTDNDNLGRIRSLAMLFSSNMDTSSDGRPDCCASPYCPKQMAFDWARQRATPRHPMPDLVDSKLYESDFVGQTHTVHPQNLSARHTPEKRPRFSAAPPHIGNGY